MRFDDGVFRHMHHQRVAIARQAHILEQTGRIQGLQAAIDAVGIERVTRHQQHVGPDRRILDPLIAFHTHRLDGAGLVGMRRAGDRTPA